MRFPQTATLVTSLAAAVFAAGLAAPVSPARASDIEVFFSTPVDASAKPNVLFILDTSQSMFSLEEEAPEVAYDPLQTYAGSCGNDRVNPSFYWTSDDGTIPDCGAGWAALSAAQFDCTNWELAVLATGFQTKTSRIAQRSGANWINMTAYPAQQSLLTACQGDTTQAGINWNAKNKGKDVYPSTSFTIYDGNWLNWATQAGLAKKYRIDLVREAVSRVIGNTEGVKIGLMRFGYDGARDFDQNTATACEVTPDPDEGTRSSNGAPVVFPVTDLDGATVAGMPGADVRAQLRYQLGVDAANENMGWVVNPSVPDALQPYQIAKGGGSTCPIPLMTPGGRSPIGGAMMEAYLYFSGKQWSQKYGKQAAFGSTFDYPSVPQSRLPGSETYKSPITDSCAKNFIVLLSDGTTEQDNDVDGPIQGLPGFNAAIGSNKCDTDPYLDVNGNPPPSQCVDDIAEYMYETDLRPNNVVAGLNNVITYTIGFKLGADAAANSARNLLRETATRGGGAFYEVGNAVQLEDAFGKIIREILTENTSFSAPAVTVNAFNRTQNLNFLYMSLFRPAFNYRWIGNIKKYELDPLDGDILDSLGNPAVDPANGFFRTNSRSFWSSLNDGNDIALGGAASRIDDYGDRVVKTVAADGSIVDLDAAGYVEADLGIQPGDYIQAGDAASGDLTAADLIAWYYGKDIGDADGDTITDESRKDMGDPLHSRPVTVIYGGDAADPDLYDDALYVVTNDGMLHAIDPTNPDDETIGGSEYWSLVPRNLVSRLRNLYYNRDLGDPEDRGYGLDANIRVLRIDNNNNGIIEPENVAGKRDKVYLFFGQRRGGSTYYAFDVTDKQSPDLMWARSYTAQGAGQSWSMPQPARVRIDDTETRVLIFGGGYDVTTQDVQPYAEATAGHGIYMVNALTGALIWRAGPDAGADLRLTEMKHSIPGDVRVIDLTGDDFADRMYAADLGGRIWRFDIFNGQPVAGVEGERLVEGGMLASLGNAEESAPRTASNSIKFFYAPDPALITRPGPNFINIAIGSGHRELPASDKTTENWFFSVRDYNVFTQLLTSWYDDDCSSATTPCHEPVEEGDLADLTDIVGADATAAVPVAIPGGSPGWRLQLEEEGEKTLAESRTFQDNVFFTTYSPVELGLTDDECGIKFGLNKLYVVSAVDARPFYNYDGVVGESTADRSKDLAQGSISPEVVFVFPTPPVDPDNPDVPQPAVPPVCLVGLENCGFGIANPPVRTYWRQRGAN